MSEPKRYRKKPIVVEAVRYAPSGSNGEAVARWCGGSLRGVQIPDPEQWVAIWTLEGEMAGKPGDYIIKGVQGEFYPCKPDIFEATYEVAE